MNTPFFTLIALLLTGFSLGAQTPAAPGATPAPVAPHPNLPPGGAAPSTAVPVPGPFTRVPRQLPTLKTNSIVVPSQAGGSNSPVVPSVPVPGTPGAGVPAAGAPAAATDKVVAIPPSARAANTPPDEMIPAGTIDFRGVDLNQVFTVYAELKNRTILRPATLAAAQIYLTTKTALTRKEAIEALDTVLGMNGITMMDFGDKFVKASLSQTAFQEGAAFSKLNEKQLPEMGSYVTHVVQLQYVKPTEMAQVLTPFAKIPNAILPIDSSQMLVLRDFTENVKRMLEMIKEIDVAVPSEFEQEVIPIKYALASEIASALNSLSTGGGSTSVGKSATSGFRSSLGGMNRPGVGTGMGGYPGTTTPYGTTPGAMGTQPGGAATGSFSDRLQNIIKKVSASGEIQILGQTKIIADERTNSLLIFASKEDMKMIKNIVAKLDIVLAQVLIEAVIMEVSITDAKDLSFSYLQHPQSAGNWTAVGAGGGGRQFFRPGDFINSGATNAAGALGGGLNYLFSLNQDLDVTVTAIQNNTKSRILQRPRIQTSHAEQATLFVGESRPYPTSSYYGGGAYGSYASIQQLQIGVTLEVKPLINTDGLVVMDIHQKIDSFEGNVTIQGVGDVPVTSSKDATAKVAVRDRETIILGGLMENDKNNNKAGIPLLMDIPVLGFLFRSTHADQTQKELIVLIRPTVLPTPEAAALAATVEKNKMPGVRSIEKDMGDEKGQPEKPKTRKSASVEPMQSPSSQPQFAPVEGM